MGYTPGIWGISLLCISYTPTLNICVLESSIRSEMEKACCKNTGFRTSSKGGFPFYYTIYE